ncbi:hypothetical protein [Lentzea sp. NBRC 105346]|uniref:hypothetical protein n=1 Tax=Lentzea sp. NBRC 105346 TaxID=3032205 RepID=UPI0025551BAB|nr:hypothetical protein [Lentzea sp. NBRC 105346]
MNWTVVVISLVGAFVAGVCFRSYVGFPARWWWVRRFDAFILENVLLWRWRKK